jgi:hypothetical protein
MYAIDVNDKTNGNPEVFSEMLDWLFDVVGPTISEDPSRLAVLNGRSTRTYKIEGTGWYYEYNSIRVSVDDIREFAFPKFFHYASSNAGGSTLYVSKVMYIENLINAMEFKLKW